MLIEDNEIYFSPDTLGYGIRVQGKNLNFNGKLNSTIIRNNFIQVVYVSTAVFYNYVSFLI